MTVEISTKQAKEFAISIYADILQYIDTHKKDYEEFLKNEVNATGERN